MRPVDLYGAIVERWLTRDAGKHTLRPDHKQELMEHLAARLWREGRRSWTARQLDQWLVDVMAERPDLRRHYSAAVSPELWQEDLRTATFLARRGDDEFAFAHSSLLEYFLARHLATALDLGPDRLDDVVARWAMPAPSAETFDFLGQLLGTDDATARRATATLRAIGTDYHPQASELAFVALAATSRAPLPSLRGIRLDGARLAAGASARPGAERHSAGALAGADLTEARLTGVDLDGADLRGATSPEPGSSTDAARCRPGRREPDRPRSRVRPSGEHLDGARSHRTEALLCDLPGTLTSRPGWLSPEPDRPPLTASWAPTPGMAARVAGRTPRGQRRRRRGGGERAGVATLTGHGGSVLAVAYSPDGPPPPCPVGQRRRRRGVRVWERARGRGHWTGPRPWGGLPGWAPPPPPPPPLPVGRAAGSAGRRGGMRARGPRWPP